MSKLPTVIESLCIRLYRVLQENLVFDQVTMRRNFGNISFGNALFLRQRNLII